MNRAPQSKILVVAIAFFALLGGPPAQADKASAHYHKGLAYKRAGKAKAAISALKTAVAAREDYAAAHYSLGVLYRQQKSYPQAIGHLKRAADLEGDNAQIWYSLGLAYYATGKKGLALKCLGRAAQLKPKDAQYLTQYGIALIREAPERAIEQLKRALVIKPSSAKIHHQLGLAYRRASARQQGEGGDAARERLLRLAEKHLLAALQHEQSAGLEFDLGVLYRRLEQPKKAIRHYENAIHLDKSLAPAYWDLAHMYTKAEWYKEAVKTYETYLRLTGRGSSQAAVVKDRLKELRGKLKESPQK